MMLLMQDRLECRMLIQWSCCQNPGVGEVFIDFSACLVTYMPFVAGECAGAFLKYLSLLSYVENCFKSSGQSPIPLHYSGSVKDFQRFI